MTETETADGQALQRLMQEAATRTRALLIKALGRNEPLPAIRFDLRGRSAGQFRSERNGICIIRYNPALLARHTEDFLRRTVPHEAAHYVVYLRHGRGVRPHGPEWERIVVELGGETTRCHDYDVQGLDARVLRSYVYQCDCGDHAITSIRHNRIARGASYICKRCGQRLRPAPEPTDEQPASESGSTYARGRPRAPAKIKA